MKRVAIASSVLVSLLSPVPAAASCGTVPPVRKAITTSEVVIVGTVIDLENLDRWATVRVDEVWEGEEVPEEIEVRAGPKGERTMTTVDRTYVLGRQYLFFPYRDRPDFYRDSACSATTAFGPRLMKFRPAGLEEPLMPSGTPTPSSVETGPPTALERHNDDPGSDGPPFMTLLIGIAALGALVALRRFLTQ